MFRIISDKKIIEGIKNQDDKTLEWLYDNYYPAIRRYITGNRGTREDASDIFQDTIIILYKQIADDTLNLKGELKGYFFGIARNSWNIQLRRKKKITELSSDIADDSTEDMANDLLLEKIVQRSLEKLKPDCRLILSLYTEGYSFEEIAVKLKFKNEIYSRRKKYLCKELLMEIIKEDPEYQEYLDFQIR